MWSGEKRVKFAAAPCCVLAPLLSLESTLLAFCFADITGWTDKRLLVLRQ